MRNSFFGELFILMAFFAAALFGGARCDAQVSLRAYAITGVTVIDASHPQPLPHQTVVIQDGVIVQLFNDGASVLPDSLTVIRAPGKFLIPGLIDTHVHMATDPSGVDNRESTLRVLRRMLYSGITTVRDMAGDARVLAGLSRDAMVGDILSPNIYYSALMAGPEFFRDPRTVSSTMGGQSGQMPYMREVTMQTDLRLAVAEARGTGARGIKLYADLGPLLVDSIVAEARRQGMLVWGHAWLQQSKPLDLVRAGVGSLSHAPLLLYQTMDSVPFAWKHGMHPVSFWDDHVHADAALLDSMKRRHVLLDATLSAYKQWVKQDSAFGYLYEITRRMAAQAYKAGVEICAGTDDDQEAFVQSEMRLLVHDAGMSPFDALVAATRNGADALGLADRVGTVAVGKVADLVVLDKNPLEDIDNVGAVWMVVKGGRMLGHEASIAQCDTILPIAVSVKVDSQYIVKLAKDAFSHRSDEYSYHITTDSVEQMQYAINVGIKNNATRPIFIWLMSCSWEDNFEINNDYISFNGQNCYKNIPHLVRFEPGESKAYRVGLSKSIKFEYPCENCIFGPQVEATRLGLIIVDDIYKPKLDNFMGYDFAMGDKSVWKIVWSNSLYLLNKKEAGRKLF